MKITPQIGTDPLIVQDNKATISLDINPITSLPKAISFKSDNKSLGSIWSEAGISPGIFDVELNFEGFESGEISIVAEAYDPALQVDPLEISKKFKINVRGIKLSNKDKFEPRVIIEKLSPKVTNLYLPIIEFDILPYLVVKGTTTDDAIKYQFTSKSIPSKMDIKTFINGEETTSKTNFDQRRARINVSKKLIEGINEIKTEITFESFPDSVVEVVEKISLDTEAPVFDNLEPEIYTNKKNPEFELIVNDTNSGIDEDSFKVLLNSVEVDFNVTVFDINGENKKQIGFKFDADLWEGKHTIEVSISDKVGNNSGLNSFDLFLDTIPPIITATSPKQNEVINAEDPLFEIFFNDDQLPAIARRPIKQMLGIGGRNLKPLHDAGIFKIYQLLLLDPNTTKIDGVKRVPLMRRISRARLVTDIEIDASIYKKLLHKTVYEIAEMSVKSISEVGKISYQQAEEFQRKISFLHNSLDLGVTRKVLAGQCTSVEGSGVKNVQFLLDGEDISQDVALSKNKAECRLSRKLSTGPHILKVNFEDEVGNKDSKTIWFQADGDQPTLEDFFPKPGAFLNQSEISLFGKFADNLAGIDSGSISVKLNNADITSSCKISDTGFSIGLTGLAEKEHKVDVLVRDKVGNKGSFSSNFFYDTTPPDGYLLEDLHITSTSSKSVSIKGIISSQNDPYDSFEVTINGKKANIKSDYSFSAKISLLDGSNEIKAEIKDRAGNFIITNSVFVFKVGDSSTAIHGKLLKEDGTPLVSGRIYIKQTNSWCLTDEKGRFCLFSKPLKSGVNLIRVKPPDNHPDKFQKLNFKKNLQFGHAYDVETLVLLDSTVEQNGVKLQNGKYTTLTNSTGEIELTMPPKNLVEFPEPGIDKVAIRLLDSEDFPYKAPGFSSGNYVLSLEPSGLKINTAEGAKLSIKNDQKVDPETILPLYSFDHLTGRYKIAAMAQVSPDGENIVTLPGHGIRSFSEKSLSIYEPQIEVLQEDKHVQGVSALNKGLSLNIDMPSFKVLNQDFSPGLVYNSKTAEQKVNVTAIFRGLKRVKSFKKFDTELTTQTQKGKKAVIDIYANNLQFISPGDMGKPDKSITQYFGLEDDPISAISESEGIRELSGFYGIRTNVITLYEIQWEVTPIIERHLWPKSITTKFFMGDEESEEFTILGKPVNYDLNGKNIDSYELPENLALNASFTPKVELPSGVYSFLARYGVNYEGYSVQKFSSIAKSLYVDPGLIENIKKALDQTTDPGTKASLQDQLQYFLDIEAKINTGAAMESQLVAKPIDSTELMNRGNAGSVIINNQINSAFGRGWNFANFSELVPVDHSKALLINGENVICFSAKNTFSVNLQNDAKKFCLLPGEKQIAFLKEDGISLFDIESKTEISTISNAPQPIYDTTEEIKEIQERTRVDNFIPVYANFYISIPYPCGISWSGIKWCYHRVIGGRFKLYDRVVSDWPISKPWGPFKNYPKTKPKLNEDLRPKLSSIVADDEENLYVSDIGTHRIYKLSKTDNYSNWEVICGKIDELRIEPAFSTKTSQSGRSREHTREKDIETKFSANTTFSPDGSLAMQSTIYSPSSMAFDKDGCLVFAEKGNNRIRRINQQGCLETIAGNGSLDYDPTINSANANGMSGPKSVSVDTVGNIYCLFDQTSGSETTQVVTKIDSTGNISHIAGNPTGSTTRGINGQLFKLEDGHQVNCSPNGTVYIYQNDSTRSRILEIDGFGLVHEHAGGGSTAPADEEDPLDSSLLEDGHFVFSNLGNLLILNDGALLQITQSLLEGGAVKMRGPVGYFNSRLRRKKDGTWVQRFKNGSKAFFNENGIQTKFTDQSDNETNFTYSPSGNLTQIDFALGQFVKLSYDGNDKISQIEDHAGRKTQFKVVNGNLEEVVFPDNRIHKFSYDATGKIISKEEL